MTGLDAGLAALVFLGTLAATAFATRYLLGVLAHRQILDQPNERSSHTVATPRGGGLGVVGVLIPAWFAIIFFGPIQNLGSFWVLFAAGVLALVSWVDDLKHLPPLPRLGTHILAVAIGSAVLAGRGLVFQGLLPPFLDAFLAALIWLWFVNLFNFMDGIDGITGVETGAVGIGLFLVGTAAGIASDLVLPALAIAGTALGFLVWNWHPARVFLGDVGSIPLGFLLGWLLLASAAAGHWQPALILPLYYLADATLTLIRRLVCGKRIWQAHREHFYQKAVGGGLSHARVVTAILATNAILVTLALVAAGSRAASVQDLWPLAIAAVAVGILLFVFSHWGRRPG